MSIFNKIFGFSTSNCDCQKDIQIIKERIGELELLYKENYDRVDKLQVRVNELESNTSINKSDINTLKEQNEDMLKEINKLKTYHVDNGNGTSGDTEYVYPSEITVQSNIPYPSYSFPTSEPEDYLVPFNDPDTGAEITRIADPSVQGGTGQELGINYSSNCTWNCDSTLIKLNDNGGNPAHIIRTDNFSTQYTVDLPPYAQWSFLDPLKMYGTTNSNEFCSLNITTGVRTSEFTFSNYSSVSIGKGEGRQDRNDQYVCLVGTRNGSPNSNAWLIVYDIQDQSIFAELDLGNNGSGLDNVTVSPFGNYVVANWIANGSGSQQGFKVYDIDLTNERHLWDDSEHSDIGIDVNGDEVLVAFAGTSRPDSYSITMVRLNDAFRKGLWYDNSIDPTGGIWGGFISCTNWKRDGYAYISEGYASDTYLNKLVALKLTYDDSNVIEDFGTHNTYSLIGYGHQSKGCASPNGDMIAFNSNWNDSTLKSWSHAPAWILKYPQN